jgi:hypothetical protein
VDVIFDRREGERRQRSALEKVERRQTDRRSRPEVDAELRARPHVVVPVEPRPNAAHPDGSKP